MSRPAVHDPAGRLEERRGLLNDLVQEHERILGVLAALQSFTAFHVEKTPEPRESLRGFVQFFREYLDGFHHGKEENVLFPAMVNAGLPVDAGPVGCMLGEHDLGRNMLGPLKALGDGSGDLTPSEIGMLGEISVGYAQLLVNHIAKENQMLYPMAERMLTPTQLDALDVYAAENCARTPEESAALEKLGATLVERFGGRA